MVNLVSFEIKHSSDLDRLWIHVSKLQEGKRKGLFTEARVKNVIEICRVFLDHLKADFDVHRSKFSIYSFCGSTEEEYFSQAGPLIKYVGPSTSIKISYLSEALHIKVLRLGRGDPYGVERVRENEDLTKVEMAFSTEKLSEIPEILFNPDSQATYFGKEKIDLRMLLSLFNAVIDHGKSEMNFFKNGFELNMFGFEEIPANLEGREVTNG